jgi:hypothetical protein
MTGITVRLRGKARMHIPVRSEFESPQGNMTINIDGHRVGDCDNQ